MYEVAVRNPNLSVHKQRHFAGCTRSLDTPPVQRSTPFLASSDKLQAPVTDRSWSHATRHQEALIGKNPPLQNHSRLPQIQVSTADIG